MSIIFSVQVFDILNHFSYHLGEIENMERDIPFLHCSLRMARNYESYVWRIFVPVSVIVLNATFVFRFDATNTISDKLNFLITNLLTVVAFFYILGISSSLNSAYYIFMHSFTLTISLINIYHSKHSSCNRLLDSG